MIVSPTMNFCPRLALSTLANLSEEIIRCFGYPLPMIGMFACQPKGKDTLATITQLDPESLGSRHPDYPFRTSRISVEIAEHQGNYSRVQDEYDPHQAMPFWRQV